jgi:hypothetical protein
MKNTLLLRVMATQELFRIYMIEDGHWIAFLLMYIRYS